MHTQISWMEVLPWLFFAHYFFGPFRLSLAHYLPLGLRGWDGRPSPRQSKLVEKAIGLQGAAIEIRPENQRSLNHVWEEHRPCKQCKVPFACDRACRTMMAKLAVLQFNYSHPVIDVCLEVAKTRKMKVMRKARYSWILQYVDISWFVSMSHMVSLRRRRNITLVHLLAIYNWDSGYTWFGSSASFAACVWRKNTAN